MDPCECIFNHEAMMRRLLTLLRDNQADCTDSDCTPTSLGADGGGNGNMLLIAMIWGLLAMFLFFMRPSSLRFGRRQGEDGQLEGKPTQSGGGDDNDPPAPPPPDVH